MQFDPGRELSLGVVAEGIETAGKEQFLLQTGCGVGRGYYYRKPLDAPAFGRFLASGSAREQGQARQGVSAALRFAPSRDSQPAAPRCRLRRSEGSSRKTPRTCS